MSSLMRAFHSLDEAHGAFGPSALTIGNFDGCHRGHQAIFRAIVQTATEKQLIPAVLTFRPHPTRVLAPERAPQLLSTIDQRITWMGNAGIRHVLVLPFDLSVAALSPEDFIRKIAAALEPRHLLVGDNFRFGRKQAGDTRLLAELGLRYGFTAHSLPDIQYRGDIVSSTRVRTLIQQGDIKRANRLLNRPYALEGIIVKGYGIGSRQTVPTLNMETAAEVLPPFGVYVTRTTCLDTLRTWKSITNRGIRPTFDGDEKPTIETFLLEPLVGDSPSRIRLEFLRFVRPEKRFDSPEELKAQIMVDAGRAKTFHRRIGKLVNP